MKYFLLYVMFIVGCHSSFLEESAEIKKLDANKIQLEKSLSSLTLKVNNLYIRNNEINAQITESEHTLKFLREEQKDPQYLERIVYILKLRIKQEHRFSLSLSKHIKDEINAVEFEIPVDKHFYEEHEIDSVLSDKFRWGSAILHSSLSSIVVRVVEKRIQRF